MILSPSFAMDEDPQDDDDDGPRQPTNSGVGLDAELDRAVPTEAANAFLMVVGGDRPGRVYALTRNTVVLGRSDRADIRIQHPSVSAEHARIINTALGFELQDLSSTNGTFIGAQRVMRARLNSGDRVVLGTVEFTFLIDQKPDATVALLPPGAVPLGMPSRALIPAPIPARMPARMRRSDDDEEEGPSLTEILRRVVTIVRFLRRYAVLIMVLAVAGTAAGLASAFLVPPPASAVCEVKLQPDVKFNPVDNQYRPTGETEDTPFFAMAERAFTNGELVRTSLRRLEGTDPEEGRVGSIGARLSFASTAPRIYRAIYKEPTFGGGRPSPLEFLEVHLKNYLDSEINKALKEINGQAKFLEDQLASVKKDLDQRNAELKDFSEKNADKLPEAAAQAVTSRFQLETRRLELTKEIGKLEGELEVARRQLQAESPLAHTKFQSSQVYKDALGIVNKQLTDLLSKGYADTAPEVRRLKDEKSRLEKLAEDELRSSTSQLERKSNPAYQGLQNQVQNLQANLAADRNELKENDKVMASLKTIVGDQPRVGVRLEELTHMRAATQRHYDQVFDRLKQAQIQVNLERVSQSARYEVVAAPHLERPSMAVTLGLRGGIGFVLGLLLTALIVGSREGKRIVTNALARLDDRRPAGP
jgi:pSer/pThr/pTyr-binding forkhead associated (FHA) protein/uncharacterized protein involved in exopolysaccharide biosynthesis